VWFGLYVYGKLIKVKTSAIAGGCEALIFKISIHENAKNAANLPQFLTRKNAWKTPNKN